MTEISETRRRQIAQELEKNGLEVTEEALGNVVFILKTNGRATVVSAVRRYVQQLKGETANSSRRSKKAEGTLNEKLAGVSNNLKNHIKQQVVSAAIQGALADLEAGDFGSLSARALSELDGLIDCEFELVEVTDLHPKYALTSNDLEPKLLPASEAA